LPEVATMGYKHCDCGGCFETVIDSEFCDECEEAGCSCDSTECKREDFGLEDEEPECLGHTTTEGPIGTTTYCDGSCRTAAFVRFERLGERLSTHRV
jgi:hypothetical protein